MPTSNSSSEDLPRRPADHVLGDVAESYVAATFPDEWIVRKIASDYGLDLEVEIVLNERVTGATFSVQVKGTDQQLHDDLVSVRLETRSINYWRRRPERVMLAVYARREQIVLWTWADDIAVSEGGNTRCTISRNDRLDRVDWLAFASTLQVYYQKRQQAYISKLQTFQIESSQSPLARILVGLVIERIDGETATETELIREFLRRIVLRGEDGKQALVESTRVQPEYRESFVKQYSIAFKAFARFRTGIIEIQEEADCLREMPNE